MAPSASPIDLVVPAASERSSAGVVSEAASIRLRTIALQSAEFGVSTNSSDFESPPILIDPSANGDRIHIVQRGNADRFSFRSAPVL